MNRYAMIANNPKGFADVALSRSAFVATNPTPGTGIASLAASTSRSATAALMNVYNAAATDGTEPYVIMPVYLRLTATTAATSATDMHLCGYLDAANRYSSGGSAITEVALVDDAGADFTDPTSKATIHFGLLTLAAATDETLVFNATVHDDAIAAEGVVCLWFGAGGGSSGAGSLNEYADVVVPPVWIYPGANLSIHQFGASQSADPEFEFEFFYIEKPNANSAT